MPSIRQQLVKPWVVMPLVALVAFGGWFGFIRKDAKPAATATTTERTYAATKGTLAKTVSADGTVAAAETDDLSFTSAGTVTAVSVAAGDTVKAGQVLATLDSPELANAVADATSSLADAEATLSDDTTAAASDAQLEADQSAVDTATDTLTNAQEALDGTKLVATFGGTVASVGITEGDQLGSGGSGGTGQTGSDSGSGNSSSTLGSGSNNPAASSNSDSNASSTPQIQVISAGRFTVDLGLDATDIASVKTGQVASIAVTTSSNTSRFGGFGNFARIQAQQQQSQQSGGSTTTTTVPTTTDGGTKGLVTEVGKVADASSGVASYPVTVAFADTTGAINAGATVSVAITYDEVQDAIQVPSFAVTTNSDGTSSVTVVKDGKHETRTVTTGLTSGAIVQITSGLSEGETVVLGTPGGATRTGNAGSGGGGGNGGGPVVEFGPPPGAGGGG